MVGDDTVNTSNYHDVLSQQFPLAKVNTANIVQPFVLSDYQPWNPIRALYHISLHQILGISRQHQSLESLCQEKQTDYRWSNIFYHHIPVCVIIHFQVVFNGRAVDIHEILIVLSFLLPHAATVRRFRKV